MQRPLAARSRVFDVLGVVLLMAERLMESVGSDSFAVSASEEDQPPPWVACL